MNIYQLILIRWLIYCVSLVKTENKHDIEHPSNALTCLPYIRVFQKRVCQLLLNLKLIFSEILQHTGMHLKKIPEWTDT